MRRFPVFALLLVLVPSAVFAQARAPGVAAPAPPAAAPAGAGTFNTAAGLAAACEQPAAAGRNFCLGALYGALGMYNSVADLAYEGKNVLEPAGHVICAPEQVNFSDLRDEFPRWVKAHPDVKDLSAPRALFFMLGEVYPCENSPLLPKK